MNKGHVYFEIQADDTQRAISFYSQIFGWKFSEVKGAPIPYWTIETGGSRGGLLQRPAKTPLGALGRFRYPLDLSFRTSEQGHQEVGLAQRIRAQDDRLRLLLRHLRPPPRAPALPRVSLGWQNSIVMDTARRWKVDNSGQQSALSIQS